MLASSKDAGHASAIGRTTNELRLPKLNARTRECLIDSLNIFDKNHARIIAKNRKMINTTTGCQRRRPASSTVAT